MDQPKFRCDKIQPYPRPSRTDHDQKFNAFIEVASETTVRVSTSSTTEESSNSKPSSDQYPYVIQFVEQVNCGAVEAKRFFVPVISTSDDKSEGKRYVQLSEEDLINAKFTKVNTYKNFRCTEHNRFFELNMYQKDPVNKHHWRLDVARPSKEIDL